MRPLRTASIAVSASSSILQNHCSDTIGSTRAPERWQKPTEWCSGCSATIRPSARSWASAASCPCSSENPSHSGFRSRSRPCSSMNSSVSSPWSRPISKSVGSWPGVTFSAPVPKPSSTRSSATIGTGRFDQRHDRGAADQVLPARVVGMHRDAGVGQDRHRAHGRDHDLAAALDVVAHRVQHVVDLAVLDLEVGDGGLERPRPVHEAAVAVDVAALVQAQEHLDHGPRVVVVHREPLAPVVHRRAEPLVLLDDHRAGLRAPLPDLVDERLAADLLARQALRGQLPLDDRLRGDARVVGAGLPQHVAALHALQADQRVLDGAVQRVAHVQRAGHVRRRQRDAVRLAGRVRFRVERVRVGPAREDARLGGRGVVPRALVQHGSELRVHREQSTRGGQTTARTAARAAA